MNESQSLIAILLDPSARADERDDAAMDLSEFATPAVESALLAVAIDLHAPAVVRDSCGESLALIWLRLGAVPEAVLQSLPEPACSAAIARLRGFGDAARAA